MRIHVERWRPMTEVVRVDPARPNQEDISRAAACLRRGGLVAFPTETVYGLGAHALDRAAVLRLFEAKGRPANDPLIVHVSAFDRVAPLVVSMPEQAALLGARFWPGPLTLVMWRAPSVPLEVTAGLETVAVRVPAHPVARALLLAASLPVAAPSANLFSRPSPTLAAHVLDDLNGRIDMVLDAGPTPVGVESTVLDLTVDPPAVLRPGAISLEMLRTVAPAVQFDAVRATTGGREPAKGSALDIPQSPWLVDAVFLARSARLGPLDGSSQDRRDATVGDHGALRLHNSRQEPSSGPMASPGLLSKHYAPRAPMTIYQGEASAVRDALRAAAREALAAGRRVGVLTTTEDAPMLSGLPVVIAELGSEHDVETVAARLYAALRALDAAQVDMILARDVSSDEGLWRAVRDRIHRAATHVTGVEKREI